MAKDQKKHTEYPVKKEKDRLYFVGKDGYVYSCKMERRHK